MFYFNSQTFDFRLFSLFCTKTTRQVSKCGSHRRHNQEGIWNPVLSYFGWRGSHRSYLDNMFQLCFSSKNTIFLQILYCLKIQQMSILLMNPKYLFLAASMKVNINIVLWAVWLLCLWSQWFLFDSHFVSNCQKENGKILGLTFLLPRFCCSHEARRPLRSLPAMSSRKPHTLVSTGNETVKVSSEWHGRVSYSFIDLPFMISELKILCACVCIYI